MSPSRLETRQRERAIIEILETQTIRTQAALAAALAARGTEATQSTLSRDIQRLGIVKHPGEDGPRYALPTPGLMPPTSRETLAATLTEFAIAVHPGDALLAIRTLRGSANAVAATLDDSGLDGIVATVAGDDTILILCRDPQIRAALQSTLKSLAGL